MSHSSYPRMRTPSSAALLAAIVTAAVTVMLAVILEQILVFVVGLIGAFLLDPLVTWLAARRVPRGLATLLVMAATALVIALLLIVFLDTVIGQATAFLAALPDSFAKMRDWILASGLNPNVQQDLVAWLDSVEEAIFSVDVGGLIGPLFGLLGSLIGSFFALIALPFFMFYVLAGRPELSRAITRSLPTPWMTDVQVVIRLGLESGGTYVRAEAIVAGLVGVMVWLALMAFSFLIDPAFAEVALLLAIIAAFSELIPNFGPWIAAIPAVLFALTVSPAATVATIILYIVIMFIEGQVLVPKIEGAAFSFHPAVVLFIVVAGIALLGLLGAILALPVTAWLWRSVKYAFRRSTGLPPGMETALGAGDGQPGDVAPGDVGPDDAGVKGPAVETTA